MDAKTAQVRIKPNTIIEEGTGGSIVWMTPARARMLVDNGAVEMFSGKLPTVQPEGGPSETKPAGPEEKKSSAAGQTGPLTDSVPSTGSATAAQQSASAAALVSPKRKSGSSAKRSATKK